MARHRRPQPPSQHAQHRATQAPPSYRPGSASTPSTLPRVASQPVRVPYSHATSGNTQRHRAARRTERKSVRQRMALPAATVVAVGVVTVGAALAVGGADDAPARPAPGATDEAAPVTSVEPLAPTGSSVAPSAQEAAEIATAVRTSPFTSEVPPGSYELTGTKLAASDPSWAWTKLRPTSADLDGAVGVLHETDGRWVLVQLGSFEVGCDITPPRVREDLDLACPTRSGSVIDT